MTKIFTAIVLLAATSAFAHGEDKKGPHKGFVRMPGAFHTEVVVNSKNTLKVYLLDIGWKNPTVLDSEIKATLISKSTEDAVCAAKKNYFLCSFSKSVNLKQKAELQVTATRENKKGNVAVYNLPLKLEKVPEIEMKKTEDKMDHSSHH